LSRKDVLRRVGFPLFNGTTSARRPVVFIGRTIMSEQSKRPAKDPHPPTADREIPRGTDEHSDSTEKRGDDRSAAAPRRSNTRTGNKPADTE
jgi:hypothetical protein